MRTGCLLLLPRCSPNINPVEHTFSKIKHYLGRAAARTNDALGDATLVIVTSSDVAGWSVHGGYATWTINLDDERFSLAFRHYEVASKSFAQG